MEKNIEQILNDLYAIDASLRGHEGELKEIIAEIIEARPDTKFDEKFVRELRSRLLERASELTQANTKAVLPSAGFFNLPKFAYALAGAGLVLVLMIPFLTNFNFGRNPLDGPASPLISFNQEVTKLGSQAFGPISAGDGQRDLKAESSSAALGLGGGGAAPAVANDSGTVQSPAPAKMSIMPIYDSVIYNYVYEGEGLKSEEPELAVYKRTKSNSGGEALAKYIAGLNFNLFDLSQLKDAKLANLNINEDREFGYSINLNLQENIMDIYANWEKWPRPEIECQDEQCFARYRLKQADVPADDKVIETADRFLQDYRIDMSGFGDGVIMNNWRQIYALTEDKADFYFPEEISVVYPAVVNGETVYDTNGNPAGLYVAVNIRFNRVSSVSSLAVNGYDSSNYPAVTDPAEVKKLAEQGGLYPDYRPETAEKTVKVILGTPKIGLIKYWSYDQKTGAGTELLVPSYIFPVANKDEVMKEVPYFYRENIVVPLVKDIADQIQPPIGLYRTDLTPLTEPLSGTSADSTGSGAVTGSTITPEAPTLPATPAAPSDTEKLR